MYILLKNFPDRPGLVRRRGRVELLERCQKEVPRRWMAAFGGRRSTDWGPIGALNSLSKTAQSRPGTDKVTSNIIDETIPGLLRDLFSTLQADTPPW
jgi:hypothetical protein